MIEETILEGIAGIGTLHKEIHIQPISQTRLRPNAIYAYVYNKSVLHISCTAKLSEDDDKFGILLHQQLSRVASEYLCVDKSSEAVECLHTRGISNIITADMTEPSIEQIANKTWDYLVMVDTLEQVDNPVSFLQSIGKHYKKNINNVIITTPNALGLLQLGKAMNNSIESVNIEQRYWFTPYTLCKVANRAGLILDDLLMCVNEDSTEVLKSNGELLLSKPMLLDSIVLVAHW